MSQIAQPDVLAVVDSLETVGQKYRLIRTLRGLLIFIAVALITTVAAGLAAHAVGAGSWARTITYAWGTVLFGGFVFLVVRPFFSHARPEWVARYIEARVPDLHNGLTNLLRLTRREDVRDHPYAPLIYAEIRTHAQTLPIRSAVKLADLYPVAWKALLAAVLATGVAVAFAGQFRHGWQQMMSPAAFVPATGEARIDNVRPGDTTLIRDQPLEVVVEATGLDTKVPAKATLFFQPSVAGVSECDLPMVAPDRFAARIDHVDRATKYRVEVGRTQSRWYDVSVIEQIKLKSLRLSIKPPTYTARPEQTVDVDPANPAARVTAAVGSRVEVYAVLDHAVSTAMLQRDEQSPVAMAASSDGTQFTSAFDLSADTSLTLLLADGSGQILARLPEQAVKIDATPDAPPKITMTFPTQDGPVPLGDPITIKADIADDVGLTAVRVLLATSEEAPLSAVFDLPLGGQAKYALNYKLDLKPELRTHGRSIRLAVQAVDNRRLSDSEGPQTAESSVYTLTFEDAKKIAAQNKEQSDALRTELTAMLKIQQDLANQSAAMSAAPATKTDAGRGQWKTIETGQTALRDRMTGFATTFKFEPADANVPKKLLMLAKNPGEEAVTFAKSLQEEPDASQLPKLQNELQTRQRRIISTLESLLAMLVASPELTEQKTVRGGDLPDKSDMAALKAALEQYMKEQQKLLDQTAPLAKKPVDDFSESDKKKLDDLLMSQEKLDAFMQAKISDFSKLAEQDMANASLLKELMEVYSEVTMAKDALKKKETEIAVSAEEMGVELAKEITSNLEKWLVDSPDRVKWDQEDPIGKTDIPMAELPKELEDMIGELMEQQEDLLEEAEDTNANWTDSLDKGAGWDAADGPIANMSAKGVTGNTLPNNNEMGGRAGEGRSGKSQGEFVEETATGKGGRNTPTRLDPTAFQQGQVNDTSKDPVGGATGGGKVSGQGGEGLEGPVPPGLDKQMERLANKQAQLRNSAERLNLQYQLGKYDNFKLLQSIAIMRRVEADLTANRYQNAMRRKDVLLDNMATSRLLVGGEIHVQQDTSPTASTRMEDNIHNATGGDLPPAWSDALKTYYEKLGRE